MNCEQCQELLSAFLDNELETKVSSSVQQHLALCAECAKLCEDFAALLAFCGENPSDEVLPPNSKALWCRINNIIESEVQAEIAKEQKEQVPPEPEKKGFWGGSWKMSFPQVAASVLGVALISSLLTIVGIKNYSASTSDYKTWEQMTAFEKVLGKLGFIETPQRRRERVIKERFEAIEYWSKRVEARRAQWDNQMRNVFDRNLREIDQAVFEYSRILEENPQDDLSGEMLDSTLDEKVELLREFSEL
jgi:Putative zinc-finger